MNKKCRDAQYSMVGSIAELRSILPQNIYILILI